METKRGNLSINSDNIFPIIKKWMYSDQDIFIRELISNGCDAITKRKKLDAVGEAKLPEGYKPKIDVLVNDKEKTLKFMDNGVGMTAEEVVKDITDIAFPARQNSWRNIRTRRIRIRSSDTSDWASIPHSWSLARWILIRFPFRKARNRCTGSATAAPSTPWEPETVKRSEPPSRFI